MYQNPILQSSRVKLACRPFHREENAIHHPFLYEKVDQSLVSVVQVRKKSKKSEVKMPSFPSGWYSPGRYKCKPERLS